ncbi:MAG TPA: FlgD immunoglobulin-like domain containing protein [Candidatus Saccharimonadales bacterium]|nr:FlgD immunoglobulin-like domain containing protein [Candidatus Saccharimonadales bacterium]
MRPLLKYTAKLVPLAFAIVFGFLITARANIYPTNIKLNGALASANVTPGQNVTISYILNEPATAVTVTIFSGATVVRTFSNAGTALGSNSVVWNQQDNGGNTVALGVYGISVAASAASHAGWTQISQDANPGTYVFYPQGLAVNNNTNSPYYGRVFVGNAMRNSPAIKPGDTDTILKCNADGSFADEGPDGNGGYAIQDDGLGTLPYKLRTGGDDRLYMLDFSGPGQVAAFDMALATNQIVLSPQTNYSANPFWPIPLNAGQGWGSMDVTGADTSNGRIWLGDADADGAGIWYWRLTNGVADPHDAVGTQAVASGGPLSDVSGGLMVDSNLDIFAAQNITDASDTNSVSLEFTNIPTTNRTAWAVGGNSLLDVNDTTIDSREHPTYVADALSGPTKKGIQLLNAATGAAVTVLDTTNQYFVTAWDNVGNLYAASGTTNRWRVFSPPTSANQATTYAVETVQIALPLSILITSVAGNNGQVVVTFSAGANYAPSAFTLQSASVVRGPYTNVSNATITSPSAGLFTASAPAPGTTAFYRISHAPGS